LPEERFFDAVKAVLHELDQLWLNDEVVSDSTAISIRETLAKRLIETRLWRNLASERSVTIEIHLAEAVAAMFMGKHQMGRVPYCYVLTPGATRVDLLLPMLMQLAEQAAGSSFVAIAYLELLEVEPHVNLLMFMSRAVMAWWRVQCANAEFWIDHRIGQRICNWIDKALLNAPVSSKILDSVELTAIVDILVQCGTPKVRRPPISFGVISRGALQPKVPK